MTITKGDKCSKLYANFDTIYKNKHVCISINIKLCVCVCVGHKSQKDAIDSRETSGTQRATEGGGEGEGQTNRNEIKSI